MSSKYKYKYEKEKTHHNHYLSEEDVLPGENTKSRIIVNTKKNFKKMSLENTAKKNPIKESKIIFKNNETNSKLDINISIENNNSVKEGIINRIKTYKNRNKTNNCNLNIKNNKSDSSKKNILMNVFSEVKVDNNKIKQQKEEKDNSLLKNYGSNRN